MSADLLSGLGHIGHGGNVGSSSDEGSGSSGGDGQNLYGNMFGKGVFSPVDASKMENIEQAFSGWLSGAHNIKMLTFGLDSIFSVQNSFDLQSASIFKFLDLAAPVAGLTLPKVLGMPAGRGR